MFAGGRGSTRWRVGWTGSPSIAVRCLWCVYAIVVCVAPLHSSHSGRPLTLNQTQKNKQASFLSYQQNDGRLLHPESESPWAESTLNDFRSVSERGLAQMVEGSLSMREVPGSIPGFSQPSYMFGKVTTKTFYRQCNFKTTFFNISKTS